MRLGRKSIETTQPIIVLYCDRDDLIGCFLFGCLQSYTVAGSPATLPKVDDMGAAVEEDNEGEKVEEDAKAPLKTTAGPGQLPQTSLISTPSMPRRSERVSQPSSKYPKTSFQDQMWTV